MKFHNALIAILTAIAFLACLAQGQTPAAGASQAAENQPEVTYHLTVMLPQYRFIDTSGYGGRVGEYDTLQQSLGGDLSLNFVNEPQRLTFKSTLNVITRDDYEAKSRLTAGKWLDFRLDSRSFVRHLEDNSFFGASVISPDIVRIDSVPPDSLLGIRRRMNKADAKVQLPNVPVKLFVKGGWQARDGNSQMQYFDMGGSGDPATDLQQGCANCHSASQFRTYNYTTRNIASGAEVTLAKLLKVTYQHEFRSFNDRMQNPRDWYGTSGEVPAVEDIPYNPAGFYVHSLLPRHQTQADSLQFTMAPAHHFTFNSDVSYARTTNLFANHQQNAFNADVTLTWNPVSRLRALADYHQQNLLNDFTQTFSLSDPTVVYTFGNPSLHRHWAGVKLAYRLAHDLDVESYYRRLNITRSDAFLWPQIALSTSPDNTDPLYVVPSSYSNVAGAAVHFHAGELWDARCGYEWTGTHNPGYVSDPRTNHRTFGDLSVSPASWITFGDDVSLIFQKSFPGIIPLTGLPLQRDNHIYTDTAFLTFRPVPKWSVNGAYTYLQDNLRTDMQFSNDAAVGVYSQSLVPYKDLSQSFSIRSSYELKERLALNVGVAHSVAHSGFRPDLNAADYPVFPGAVDVAGYTSDAAFATAFSQALGLGSGFVSRVDVPQTIFGSTVDYHRAGFDGGLRFNYGSYTDRIRPDLTGKLRSYTAFFGKVW
jgi:hypothetical protein